jgi:hypothetical protein
MAKPSMKNRSLSNLKRRAVINTCLLILVIAAMIFMKQYHSAPVTRPGQTAPSVKSTATGTNKPVSRESRYDKSGDVRAHQLQELDRQFLVSKGLQNPVHDIVKDLMVHNELIPCKGTLGGTQGFYSPDRIAVLSRDRVIADYDDGHVEGTIELTFTVVNGTISWKVVHSDCGE